MSDKKPRNQTSSMFRVLKWGNLHLGQKVDNTMQRSARLSRWHSTLRSFNLPTWNYQLLDSKKDANTEPEARRCEREKVQVWYEIDCEVANNSTEKRSIVADKTHLTIPCFYTINLPGLIVNYWLERLPGKRQAKFLVPMSFMRATMKLPRPKTPCWECT